MESLWWLLPLALALLVGALCPMAGTLLLVQRRLFLANLVSHAVLPGLALALALRLDPGLGGVISGVAGALLAERFDDMALVEQDLRRIIDLDPQNARALNHLGYAMTLRTDRYQEAMDLINRALTVTPDDPAIIDSLGWVQYKLGMYPEARTHLDKAYELFPDAEVAAHLGEVLWVMGDKSAATRVWRNALATQPDSEHIRSAMQRLNPAASL
jgi:Flp pilus assembly protein TadD